LIVAVVVSELAGIIGSIFTSPAIPEWYAGLVKPALNPPSWVFAPVWIALYALMGISLYLVWKSDPAIVDPTLRKKGIALFFIQLALNSLWSILFFGMKNPFLAFAEIIFLWIAILGTIFVFSNISKKAAWLLIPYILWVSFAAYLNYSIMMLN